MNARLFSAKHSLTAKKLQPEIEWHSHVSAKMREQIAHTHISAFADLYKKCTAAGLELKDKYTSNPTLNTEDKKIKAWLSDMINSELDEVNNGNISLVTISLDNTIVGFATCEPLKTRFYYERNSTEPRVDVDVYLSLLATRPLYDPKNHKKIRVGFGRQLIASIEERFATASAITLDTRRINTIGIAFYKELGFLESEYRTFSESSIKHYVGFEKRTDLARRNFTY